MAEFLAVFFTDDISISAEQILTAFRLIFGLEAAAMLAGDEYILSMAICEL